MKSLYGLLWAYFMTDVIRSAAELQAAITAWRTAGLKICFVPTMGALHDGHLSLVRLARQHGDRVVISIFVNPAQFETHEKLIDYPHTEGDDLKKLDAYKVDLVYLPTVEEIYPNGTLSTVDPGPLAQGLCGAMQPGFFAGVASVIKRLFDQVQPDVAIFGEKDYQQLLVIRDMVRRHEQPIEIIGAPIIRDRYGLAYSSRNHYLSDGELQIARRLNKVLDKLSIAIRAGRDVAETLEMGEDELLAAGFDKIDYLELRECETLAPLASQPVDGRPTRPARPPASRLFAAAHIGKVRLIDNWPVDGPA